MHKVQLTNEEFHYVSELLANRLEEITRKSLYNVELTLKYAKETELIVSLISEKFISI